MDHLILQASALTQAASIVRVNAHQCRTLSSRLFETLTQSQTMKMLGGNKSNNSSRKSSIIQTTTNTTSEPAATPTSPSAFPVVASPVGPSSSPISSPDSASSASWVSVLPAPLQSLSAILDRALLVVERYSSANYRTSLLDSCVSGADLTRDFESLHGDLLAAQANLGLNLQQMASKWAQQDVKDTKQDLEDIQKQCAEILGEEVKQGAADGSEEQNSERDAEQQQPPDKSNNQFLVALLQALRQHHVPIEPSFEVLLQSHGLAASAGDTPAIDAWASPSFPASHKPDYSALSSAPISAPSKAAPPGLAQDAPPIIALALVQPESLDPTSDKFLHVNTSLAARDLLRNVGPKLLQQIKTLAATPPAAPAATATGDEENAEASSSAPAAAAAAATAAAAAAGNNPHAQYLKFIACYDGLCGEVVSAESDLAARRWAELGAAQQHAGCINGLGLMCAQGRGGFERDAVRALEFWTRAADLGWLGAKANIGLAHALGQGVPKSRSKAIAIWTAASEEGDGSSMAHLGNVYSAEDGVENDEDLKPKSPTVLAEAKDNHESNAAVSPVSPKDDEVASPSSAGDAVSSPSASLSPDPVKKDESKAFGYFLQAAMQGVTAAQYNVALAYHYPAHGANVLVEHNLSKAFQWYLLAAEQGNDPDAQFAVAQALAPAAPSVSDPSSSSSSSAADSSAWSQFVKPDAQRSLDMYTRAAEQGHAAAMNNLGLIYSAPPADSSSSSHHRDAAVAPHDLALAAQWFHKAALLGHSSAQQNYAHALHHGLGVTQSFEHAFEWMMKAAQKAMEDSTKESATAGNIRGSNQRSNHPSLPPHPQLDAVNSVAMAYARGVGVERSLDSAALWWSRGAALCHRECQFNLGWCYHVGAGVEGGQDQQRARQMWQHAADKGHQEAKFRLQQVCEPPWNRTAAVAATAAEATTK